jgi:hypothetical protein
VCYEIVYPENARAAYILPKPEPSWMFVEEERGHQKTTEDGYQ